MKSFLEDIAEKIIEQHPSFDDVVLVLPGKRAGLFLKNKLLSLSTKNVFAPTIVSVEEFISNIAELDSCSTIELLFEFYYTYSNTENNPDSFEDFLKWAPIILQDFNEIDRYLVNPKEIFSYLSAIQNINHWYLQENKTPLQEKYITFWKNLGHHYNALYNHLIKKEKGYQGMLYREAAKRIDTHCKASSAKHYYFIGFNALNKAEEHIISTLEANKQATIFWDIDKAFLNNQQHEAGFFIRKYLKNKDKITTTSSFFAEKKNIHIVGCPKNISQGYYIGEILEKNKTPSNTAVVLADESLLLPTLQAIPESIDTVNITMGLPLKQTSMASFISLFFSLYNNQKKQGWYYKNVLSFLSHPHTIALFEHLGLLNSLDKLIYSIKKTNRVIISKEQIIETLGNNKKVNLIFNTNLPLDTDNSKFINTFLEIIVLLKEALSKDLKENKLALEQLLKFYTIFNQLKTLVNTYTFSKSLKSLHTVYKELLQTETLDYIGEPWQGLQIIGMLESRNLDFSTVIIASVNEGVLPAGKSYNSFIPFDVKVLFNLPSYKEKDAIYAYHFYRLLQRAENIYLLYNTEPDTLKGGEKSRFILQLLNQPNSNYSITESIASPTITYIKKEPITVANTAQEALKKIAAKGISPSALTNYIRNPIDFYHQTILGIKEADYVEETIAGNTTGTIIHETLEQLYTPYLNILLQPEHIEQMLKVLPNTLLHVFEDIYKNSDFNTGKNLIIFNVAQQYITTFLKNELTDIENKNTIKVLFLEKKLEATINHSQLNYPIKLKGIVDRIDQHNGITRIIDYKTGRVTPTELQIFDWSLLLEEYKYSKAFQVLTYVYLLYKNTTVTFPVEAGIISFKSLQQGFIPFGTKESTRSSNKEFLITENILLTFENVLITLLQEIFCGNQPFIEKKIN